MSIKYKGTKMNGGELFVPDQHNCNIPALTGVPPGSYFLCDCSRKWYVVFDFGVNSWHEDTSA